MAYLPESEADRQRRLQQEQGQSTGPQVAQGASGVITGGAPQAGQAPTMGKGPTRSGAFTNLNAYLQANKDQAAQLGERVAGRIDQNAQTAQQKVGQLDTQFRQQADQNSVQRDQSFVQNTVQNANQAVKDPTNVQRFARMRDAVYKGPQGVEDVDGYTDTHTALSNTSRDLENTKSEGGRFALVQDQFGRPTYQRGQQRLDQLLLQNSPEARQSLQGVQQRYQGIGNMLNQTSEQARAYAAQRKADTDAARQDVQQALGQLDDPTTPQNEAAGAFGSLQTDVRSRAEQLKAQEAAAYQRMKEQLGIKGQAQLDADTMQRLGLTAGQKLYDFDLSSVVPEFNADSINEQTAASADDYSRYAALAQLAGVDPSYLADSKLAGTAKGVQVDRQHIQDQLANAQARFDEHDARRKDITGVINSWYDGNATYIPTRYNGTATADQIRQTYKSAVDALTKRGQQYGDPNWVQDVLAGKYDGGQTGTNLRRLNEWLKQYDSLQPNRTLTQKD